jgi:2-isopropylmalate synthase
MAIPELYDCTLREGEQAAGASFNLESRVELFEALDNFGFDFIEVGWPLASTKIFDSFSACKKIRKNAKIVAFGSTAINQDIEKDANLNSILSCGADYACIFGKSHMNHVVKQLKLTPGQNLDRIRDSVLYLKQNGLPVFYDAEHFFDAFLDNQDYSLATLVSAAKAGAKRIILCDTNGGMLPNQAKEILEKTKDYLKNFNVEFGVHFHNDCGLGLANALESLPFVKQVQGTINGIGERVGNLNFSEFIPVCMKKLDMDFNVNLEGLKELNEKAYRLGGLDIPESRPFVGNTAFAHKGGVHIDATQKGASYEHCNPLDFGNKRLIVLNTLGGCAGVAAVAEQFNYTLDKKNPDVKRRVELLFKELNELEEKGYRLGCIPAEQYLLIEKYFGNFKEFFDIPKWRVEIEKEGINEKSKVFLNYRLDTRVLEDNICLEGGPVDAVYKSLMGVLSKRYPAVSKLKLVDFHVGIARSSGEESSVRTLIDFEDGEKFQTVGVDNNIIESAIEAVSKGFRYYLNRLENKGLLNLEGVTKTL